MCASYHIPSPRVEPKRRRSHWLNSCCGIFEDYDPDEFYSVSPANARRPEAYSASPDIRHNDWLGSCCGVFEEYDDPVINHPETHPVGSPAISVRKAEAEEESQVSGPIWRRNIIMGGKCKLPDFSGVIIYDSAGNLVSNSKPTRLALTWK